MVNSASEDDYNLMIETAGALASQHPRAADWIDSPFRWLLPLPPATRGKVGRQLVWAWAERSGFTVEKATRNRQLYLRINDQIVQVKTSTLWHSGIYKFQQIRDRDYDYCFCLGISPLDMNAWIIPKEALELNVINQRGQHTGSDSAETWWFETRPESSMRWLEPYGNQLSHAREALLY